MKKTNFDERQIIDRGKAFQIGFIVALVSIALVFLATDAFEFKIDTFTSFIVTIWTPMTACFIMLIAKDAYEGINQTGGRIIISVLGFCGVFMLISKIILLLTNRSYFIENGIITENIGHIFQGLCMTVIFIVYWVKQYINKKNYPDE